jgi:hypothetical protein
MIFKFVRVKKPKEEILKHIGQNIDKKQYYDDYIEIFEIDQTSLSEDIWKFMPIEENELLTKIKNNSSCALGTLAGIHRCLYTGLNEAYVVDGEIITNWNLERELLKPVLRGEDVRRWSISWIGLYVIYPYRKIKGKTVKVSIRSYPNAEKYLQQFRKKLMSRWYIKKVASDKRKEDKWFEYADPRNHDQFETEKLLTPDISTRNNFTLDIEGYYCLNVIYAINPDTTKASLKYLLGLLNSRLLEYYFKHFSPFISGGYYRYITQYLEQLPIKLPRSNIENNLADEIFHKVNQIMECNKRLETVKLNIKEFPESYFEGSWSFDKLMNVVKAQSLSQPSYSISEKLRTDYKQKDLDGRETFRIILAPNEFVDFNFEEIASYVLEVLKTMNSVTKRELLEMKIPQQPPLNNLMNQHRKDKEQIVKNEEAIEELERQIDDLVYKLYDITYAERRFIEDFLKKF